MNSTSQGKGRRIEQEAPGQHESSLTYVVTFYYVGKYLPTSYEEAVNLNRPWQSVPTTVVSLGTNYMIQIPQHLQQDHDQQCSAPEHNILMDAHSIS